MKKLISVTIVLVLLSASFFIASAFASGNCTKDEVMKMLNAGFTKKQIDDVCNAECMCCCSYIKTTWDDYYRTTKWMSCDSCNNMKKPDILSNDPKAYCTEKSYCGR